MWEEKCDKDCEERQVKAKCVQGLGCSCMDLSHYVRGALWGGHLFKLHSGDDDI